MKNLFTETGALTPEGEELLRPIIAALEELFETDEFSRMPEQEVNILQTHLMKMIGDGILNRIVEKRERANSYSALTDDQFYAHLVNRYGQVWMFMTLEPEELTRVAQIAKRNIDKALEEIRTNFDNHPPPYMQPMPRGPFMKE